MFKVIIIGGNQSNNYQFFEEKCIKCLRNKTSEGIMIYTTGDDFVERFGKRFNIDMRIFYANFKKNGNNALKMRNDELFKDAEALIAFDSGIKDTEVLINLAKAKNLPIRIFNLGQK